MGMTRPLAICSCLLLLLSPAAPACGPAKTTSGTTPPAEAASFAAQAQRGEALYGQHCASCHGARGEGGGRAPALVGPEALATAPSGGQRDVEFRTAGDVYQWVKGHMPPGAPDSLGEAAYLEIVAFDLKANGIAAGPEPLTPESAAKVVLRPE
jgi:mono/diheme cytochrome c family protein